MPGSTNRKKSLDADLSGPLEGTRDQSRVPLFLAHGCFMLDLEGRLYGSKSGYLLLQVPNDMAMGFFAALPEIGLVPPVHHGDKFNAHITVMRPEELARVGGLDAVNERGRSFKYSVVGADSIEAARRDSRYSRYWMLLVRSSELNKLRRTYGLPAEPDVPFHITFAARPRYVTFENGISKLSEILKKPHGEKTANSRQREAWGDLELVHTSD